jgi:hypothetical protein
MKNRLIALEYRAVSGAWLLGDFNDIIISKETYKCLWNNAYNICDNPRLVKMFWANSSQYYRYRFSPYFKGTFIEDSQKPKTEEKEREDFKNGKEFLEFHYALGGLMLFRKQFNTVNYFFEYTQSTPANYDLLPNSLNDIFQWFHFFFSGYIDTTPIEFKYYFPELDNLGTKHQINYWICSYITLLYIRHLHLTDAGKITNYLTDITLPEKVLELEYWLEFLIYFEKYLIDVIANKKLLRAVQLQEYAEEHKHIMLNNLNELKTRIQNTIRDKRIKAKISDAKVQKFLDSSNHIISTAFSHYESVFKLGKESKEEIELNLFLVGETTTMSKSSFIEGEVEHFNFDTVFAEAVSEYKIKRALPGAFFSGRTRQYLVEVNSLVDTLKKLSSQSQDVIIVCISTSWHIKQQLLANTEFNNCLHFIPSSVYEWSDTFFVLNRKELPTIDYSDIQNSEIEELKLIKLKNKFNTYASVVQRANDGDLAPDGDNLAITNNTNDYKVQLTIAFNTKIYWKRKRDVVQLNIRSQFKEQGIINEINDIWPIKSEKSSSHEN